MQHILNITYLFESTCNDFGCFYTLIGQRILEDTTHLIHNIPNISKTPLNMFYLSLDDIKSDIKLLFFNYFYQLLLVLGLSSGYYTKNTIVYKVIFPHEILKIMSVITGNADDRHSLFRSGNMDVDTNVSNVFL